uniref:Endonuclease/exonuclease/phosphatase domain-containing protein n=2 Tax=Brassica oleracea TaxID=3712 RepID=A0A0D3AK17_BRAOL
MLKNYLCCPLLTKLYPAWHFTSNHLSDEDGRIILIWKDPLKLHVVHQSWQSLTCLITIPNKEPFYYTAVYASNLVADRSDLWTELIHLHSSLDLENKVWFVGGDFNQIQHHSEHSSPSVSSNDYQMYLLQDCLTQLGLFDLRFTGPSHTWTNNQPDDPIAKKLDRLLVNSTAVAAYPHALSSFLPPDISDHTPCLLDLAYHLPTAGTHPYKFQNYLTKHPNFSVIILEAWTRTGSLCSSLADLCWKLKLIKTDLKTLNRENYSKIQERVSDTYSLLQHVQVQALQSPSPQTYQEERDLHQKWTFLCQIQECFFQTEVENQLAKRGRPEYNLLPQNLSSSSKL